MYNQSLSSRCHSPGPFEHERPLLKRCSRRFSFSDTKLYKCKRHHNVQNKWVQLNTCPRYTNLFRIYAQGGSFYISGLGNIWKISRLPWIYGEGTISYVVCIICRVQLRNSVTWDIWTLAWIGQKVD